MPRVFLLLLYLLCASQSAFAACPAAPPAISDIRANSYYTDAAGSIIDKALYEQYKKNVDPITDFQHKVLVMADAYVGKNDQQAGRCAISWLMSWVKAGALTGQLINERGSQANYIQKWTLAGLAMAAFKVRDLLTAEDHQLLDPWLAEQARRALSFWDDGKHKHNNHYYWSAFAVAASAAVSKDEALWSRARAMYEEALGQISSDGTLPYEMARAGRALHYHNYALMPLAGMAELSRSHGEDWYRKDNDKLFKLAERVTDGLLDPSWFASRTAKAQEIPKERGSLGWTIWMAEFPLSNAAKLKAFAARGPFVNIQLGGDAANTRTSVQRAQW